MKNCLLFLIVLSCLPLAYGQFPAEHVTELGRWDNDDLTLAANQGSFNDVWGYSADGREYAIIGSALFVHFLDVTDPANIRLVDEYAPGDTTIWRDFKVYENYCYAVSDKTTEGLLVFDLSDLPNSVELVEVQKDIFVRSHNIYIEVEQGRLYTAGAGHGSIVYDIKTDPSKPVRIGIADMNHNYVHDIYVRDNIAYASSGDLGLYIWDVTDPSNEKLLASSETNGYNHSSWLTDDGKYALFAEEVPLGLPMGIMDLSELEDGDILVDNYFKNSLEPSFEKGATAHNPYIRGDYAYVSYYHDGMVVYDVSDPQNPTRAGYFDTHPGNENYEGYRGAWGCFPYLPSGNILISDINNGLFVLDFDPVAAQADNLFDIAIYPNPSRSVARISYNLPAVGTMNLYSVNGSLLHSQTIDGGVQNIEMVLDHLPAGLYLLELATDSARQTEKINVL